MKRYIILTGSVVFAMAMTACVRESMESPDVVLLGADEFAFSIGKAATKASVEGDRAARTIKLGDTGYYMEETVESLDAPAEATKGSPIYTENIQHYYETINVVAYPNGVSNELVSDSEFKQVGTNADGKPVYSRRFAPTFWPDETTPIRFFLRTPAEYIDETAVTTLADESTVSSMAYSASDGKISFDYTSKYKGSEQQDMLFTSTMLTREQYFDATNQYFTKGAPVTFYHALTGVKFRSGSDNTGTTKTIITGVTLKGLKDTGHCVIDPAASGSDPIVQWSGLDMKLGTFSQTFDNPDYTYTEAEDGTITVTSGDGTIDYTGTPGYTGTASTSWTSAAAGRNLNDEDGSLTFWLIPQQLNENVVLEITFRVKTPDSVEGTEITHTVKFGDLVRTQTKEGQTITYGPYPTWKAGELRTYTLNPHDVDVEIKDTMSGMKKENLHVANTGNVAEYVRMLIVGNWYGWLSEASMNNGDEPSILIGYKTDGSGGEDDNEMVPYWDYRDENKLDGSYFDNTFKYGKTANGNKWVRGSGAYYYPFEIGAGEALPSGTDALFKSYEYPAASIPDIYIPSTTSNVRTKAVGVHLVMEVVVQAIPTRRADGTEYDSIWQAWSETTGTTIGPKN